MNLLVDIGNTRVKWAYTDNTALFNHGAFSYTPGAFAGLLESNWQELEQPAQVCIATVTDAGVTTRLYEYARSTWNLEPQQAVTEKERAGLRNAYDDVTTMGVDRWLAMLAAWVRYERPLCVIDCGTALTVDVILEDGQHSGGLILPGLFLGAAALARETHGIGNHRQQELQLEFGRSTAACIGNGFALALAGLLDRCLEKIRADHDAELLPVITGGAAEQLLPLLPGNPVHEPHLVLHGLAFISSLRSQAGAAIG